jgi:hypothetical protein
MDYEYLNFIQMFQVHSRNNLITADCNLFEIWVSVNDSLTYRLLRLI